MIGGDYMNHSCPKCNEVLTKCLASGGIKNFTVVKLPEKIFSTKETSTISPFVCSNCGYTEWYADQPENIK